MKAFLWTFNWLCVALRVGLGHNLCLYSMYPDEYPKIMMTDVFGQYSNTKQDTFE